MTGERIDNGERRQSGDEGPNLFLPKSGSAHRPPSRAVSRNRSRGNARVFVVRLDGLDHEIEFVGAVDFAGDATVLAWRRS